ncbi:MAG: carbonic anhydrase [Micropruina sp.]|uniref:carbonic anhydrase n=1 Tax=Micropruina sp. TaxID=2737536 RepID=UPI0039E673CD
MPLPPSVPDWMRPEGLPAHRMPSAQALQRLIAGNGRRRRERAGENLAPGDAVSAAFPFALVVGCLEPGAASEDLFAERPGAVECVRTAGPSLGSDTMAAIEYAALVQNVGIVLVLGHRNCAAVIAAREARAAGRPSLPGALGEWVPMAAAGSAALPATGGTASDSITGHVRALRAELRRADSLLSLTRSGQLKIAGGVLDDDTGGIDFLPDEPDDVVEPVGLPRADRRQYGS